MKQNYLNQVGLLVEIIPYCFDSVPLALKGGTALNLFYNNMPRLSVDLDCVYVDRGKNPATRHWQKLTIF